jgi:exonuclease III
LTEAFVRAGHFHKKLGLRLDAFPLSPPLAERLESCGIDRDFP